MAPPRLRRPAGSRRNAASLRLPPLLLLPALCRGDYLLSSVFAGGACGGGSAAPVLATASAYLCGSTPGVGYSTCSTSGFQSCGSGCTCSNACGSGAAGGGFAGSGTCTPASAMSTCCTPNPGGSVMQRCFNSSHTITYRWASSQTCSGSPATPLAAPAAVAALPPAPGAAPVCLPLPTTAFSQTSTCVVGAYTPFSTNNAVANAYSTNTGLTSTTAACTQATARGVKTYDLFSVLPCYPYYSGGTADPNSVSSLSLACASPQTISFDNQTEGCAAMPSSGRPELGGAMTYANSGAACTRATGTGFTGSLFYYMTGVCNFPGSVSASPSSAPSVTPPPRRSVIFLASTNVTLPREFSPFVYNESVIGIIRVSVGAAAAVPVSSIVLASIITISLGALDTVVVQLTLPTSASLTASSAVASALLAMTSGQLAGVPGFIAVATGLACPVSSIAVSPMPDQLSSLCLTNAADPYGFAPCALPHNASLSATPQPTFQPQPVDMALPITAGVAALCLLVAAFFFLYTLNRRGHVSNIALRALRKSGVLSAQTVAHMSASMGYGASGGDGQEAEGGEPGDGELQHGDPNMREVTVATYPRMSMRAVGIAAPETVNSEQALQQNEEERIRWGPAE